MHRKPASTVCAAVASAIRCHSQASKLFVTVPAEHEGGQQLIDSCIMLLQYAHVCRQYDCEFNARCLGVVDSCTAEHTKRPLPVVMKVCRNQLRAVIAYVS
uniref:Uncharacterized protein n=1 Tax=Peronospora matthiolae TaxID=2874970 RepID=A0AAV1TKU8_9STRA